MQERTGFTWFRKGTNGGQLRIWYSAFGLHNIRGPSGMAAKLSASQDELCLLGFGLVIQMVAAVSALLSRTLDDTTPSRMAASLKQIASLLSGRAADYSNTFAAISFHNSAEHFLVPLPRQALQLTAARFILVSTSTSEPYRTQLQHHRRFFTLQGPYKSQDVSCSANPVFKWPVDNSRGNWCSYKNNHWTQSVKYIKKTATARVWSSSQIPSLSNKPTKYNRRTRTAVCCRHKTPNANRIKGSSVSSSLFNVSLQFNYWNNTEKEIDDTR